MPFQTRLGSYHHPGIVSTGSRDGAGADGLTLKGHSETIVSNAGEVLKHHQLMRDLDVKGRLV